MKIFLTLLVTAILAAPVLAGEIPAVDSEAPTFNLQDQNGD